MNKEVGPSPEVDPRLVDQRLRNRIAESLEWLTQGADGVTHMGAAEYLNQFFDNVDDEMTDWRGNTAMTNDEVAAVQRVLDVMLDVCAATPDAAQDADLIGSPALARLVTVATAAVETIDGRGRFDEEVVEPSVHRLTRSE